MPMVSSSLMRSQNADLEMPWNDHMHPGMVSFFSAKQTCEALPRDPFLFTFFYKEEQVPC